MYDISAWNGGAVSLETLSVIVFINTNFWANSASAASLVAGVSTTGTRTHSLTSYGNGGALAVTTAQSLWLVNVSLFDNTADSLGGALFLRSSKLSHIVNCTYDKFGNLFLFACKNRLFKMFHILVCLKCGGQPSCTWWWRTLLL